MRTLHGETSNGFGSDMLYHKRRVSRDCGFVRMSLLINSRTDNLCFSVNKKMGLAIAVATDELLFSIVVFATVTGVAR